MTSFKDFFNSKTKNPGEPSGSTAIAAVSSAVARGLTSSSDVLTVTTCGGPGRLDSHRGGIS